MIQTSSIRNAVTCVAAVIGLAGCSGGGGRPSGPTIGKDAIAKQKVENMNKLADAAATDPNGGAVRGLLEEMRHQPLNATEFPDEAAQIVKIYNERLKGKLGGDEGREVSAMVAGLEHQLKAAGKPG
jgi:hypothetical protein